MKTTKKIKEDLNEAQFDYVMRNAVAKCMKDLELEPGGFDDDLELLMNDEELLPRFTICIMKMLQHIIFDNDYAKLAKDNFNKDLN